MDSVLDKVYNNCGLLKVICVFRKRGQEHFCSFLFNTRYVMTNCSKRIKCTSESNKQGASCLEVRISCGATYV